MQQIISPWTPLLPPDPELLSHGFMQDGELEEQFEDSDDFIPMSGLVTSTPSNCKSFLTEFFPHTVAQFSPVERAMLHVAQPDNATKEFLHHMPFWLR